MSHPLGGYVAAEVGRAEKDFEAFRSRGQSALTLSGGLVTVLGAIVAFAVSDSSVRLDPLTKVAASVALVMFFLATIFVLLMFNPKDVVTVDATKLRARVDNDKEWRQAGWDQTVALIDVDYLVSLRAVIGKFAKLLRAAILCQVVGVMGVLVLVLTLLSQGQAP